MDKLLGQFVFLILPQKILARMESQQIKKEIKLKDLPRHLQQKYKDSILFENQNHQKSRKYHFDRQKIKERKAEKQKTFQEKLQEYKINHNEEKQLARVFKQLSASNNSHYFSSKEIAQTLKKMKVKMTNLQIDRMIWEFDEKLNNKISYQQFVNMYKKCSLDKTAAQSKTLFHLTQFLMFCKPHYYRITVEDTLQLLYVRAKLKAQMIKVDEKELLEDQIKSIFGNQEKNSDGIEIELDFTDYLQKIKRNAREKRKKALQISMRKKKH